MRFTRLKEFGEYLIIELFGGNLWMKLSMEISVGVSAADGANLLASVAFLALADSCLCVFNWLSQPGYSHLGN